MPWTDWEAGDVDWPNHRLIVGGKRWYGAKVLDPMDLSPEIAAVVAADFEGGEKPDVSDAALEAFLTAYVDVRPAGDIGLTEANMLAAATKQFPLNTVTRERIRAFIGGDKMDPAKRFQRGRPPR
jgi:hypothetical protein